MKATDEGGVAPGPAKGLGEIKDYEALLQLSEGVDQRA
jgi:hypothetical protein